MESRYQTVLFCGLNQTDPNCAICARDTELGTVLMTYRGGCLSIVVVAKDYMLGADEFKPLIYVWALNKRDPKLRIVCKGVVSAMTLSPSENYILASVEEKIYIWMLPAGSLYLVLTNHLSRITCLSFSLVSPTFVSADEHGHLALWALPRLLSKPTHYTHTPSLTFTRHSAKILCVVFAKHLLYSSSTDSTIKVWDTIEGRLVQDILMDVPASSLAIHCGGHEIYAGFMDGSVKKLNQTGQVFQDFNAMTGSAVRSLQILDVGTLVSASIEGEVSLWQLETGICRKTIHFISKLSCVHVKEMCKGWAESNHSKAVFDSFPVLKFEPSTKEEKDSVTINMSGERGVWDEEDRIILQQLKETPQTMNVADQGAWSSKAMNEQLYHFMIDKILNQ